MYSRNVKFYNRTNIFKVTRNNGVVEILAMETMSAMPIQEKVAMAMALIPSSGVEFIQTGSGVIPVPTD